MTYLAAWQLKLQILLLQAQVLQKELVQQTVQTVPSDSVPLRNNAELPGNQTITTKFPTLSLHPQTIPSTSFPRCEVKTGEQLNNGC